MIARGRKCATCPWRDDGLQIDDLEREKIVAMASAGIPHQCHHHQLKGAEPDYYCRGTIDELESRGIFPLDLTNADMSVLDDLRLRFPDVIFHVHGDFVTASGPVGVLPKKIGFIPLKIEAPN